MEGIATDLNDESNLFQLDKNNFTRGRLGAFGHYCFLYSESPHKVI
jgi:hypothetical protein